MNTGVGLGSYKPTPFNFALIPTHTPEQLLDNVRYALTLGLPDVTECRAHETVLSVAGGGPSLGDTYRDLTGYVAAVNGSVNYLLDKGIVPQMCGICHPKDNIVDIVAADPRVTYFVGSCVHPRMFDKLLAAGCKVYLWHLHPIDGLEQVLNDHYGTLGWTQIPGGTTMGLRWITLGYHLGFRKFHLHGFDSSFRDKSSHAYPDHQDAKEWITYDGYQTRIPFLGQVEDFLALMENARTLPDPPEITMFGDGLLQMRYRHWLEANAPFVFPDTDIQGRVFMRLEAHAIAGFMKLIPKRGTCIQAGGNVGIYARSLSGYFNRVITFEPNRDNFACLEKNLASRDNVVVWQAALGECKGEATTHINQPGHCGTYYVKKGKDIPVIPIDDLHLDECDLLWLDVEGYEEPALRGAAATIHRYKPAVIIEENGNAKLHEFDPDGASKWLKERQYHRVQKIGNDWLYVYGGT